MMTLQQRMGEFFSGPGGLALGASKAAEKFNQEIAPQQPGALPVKVTHQWAVDIDADSCETYRRNVLPHTPEAVHNMDAREAANKIASFHDIDGFAFGFPCNDFSLVGKQRGLEGAFGPLYQTGLAVLRSKQPQWFVAENVGGIRSANGGNAFLQILADLEASGYNITPHLYKFEEYGVPQTRHRVILAGIHKDLELEFKVPAPTHGPGLKPFVTAGEALGRPYPDGLVVTHTEQTRQSRQVIERLKLIDPGENAFNAKRMTDEFRLNVKGAHLSQIYKRLEKDKPSYTITGSGGGGTHAYHWEEHRALTNRERARIQTFPDEFTFVGSKESVRRQIGMAVPVEGATVIFKALIQTIQKIEYHGVKANLLDTLEASRSLSPTFGSAKETRHTLL